MHSSHLTLALLLSLGAPVTVPAETPASAPPDRTSAASKDRAKAVALVNRALTTVRKMGQDPVMKEALHLATGVYIVPSYRRVAVGVGATGGGGVMLLKRPDGQWGSPVFYTLGALNVGLQAGAQHGEIALVLMNEKAATAFTSKNNFSLSADAGLTVFNWNKLARGALGTGDVIVWATGKGLFGDVVALGVEDIRFNQNLTNAYYERTLSASEVTSGSVGNTHSVALQQALGELSSTAR